MASGCGWQAWDGGVQNPAWFAAAGVAESMAAGAVVLGYYFLYWWGVRRHLRSHLARASSSFSSIW